MNVLYTHYSDYKTSWNWPGYPPSDVACPHCGELCVNEEALDALQLLREEWGEPIPIVAAHRCRAYNAELKQSETSLHTALAFDCICPAQRQREFSEIARACGFTGTGRYHSKGYVHLDVGPSRNWAG